MPFKATNKGGRIPGAGRKKAGHTIAAEAARAYVVQRVVTEIKPIMDAQVDLAKGIYVEEKNDKGERVRVYQKEPDTVSAKYLLDQTIGRAKETIEMNSKLGIFQIIQQLDAKHSEMIEEAKVLPAPQKLSNYQPIQKSHVRRNASSGGGTRTS